MELSMNQVQVEQKSYQMPPQDGFSVSHFLTVADVERSLRFYETVFECRILSGADSSGAPGYIQIASSGSLSTSAAADTGQTIDDAQRPRRPKIQLAVL
jgi:predicted enzyme related to lactoylglutathione lyase